MRQIAGPYSMHIPRHTSTLGGACKYLLCFIRVLSSSSYSVVVVAVA